GVVTGLLQMSAVIFAEEIQMEALQAGIRLGRSEMGQAGFLETDMAVADPRALVTGGQKRRTVVLGAAVYIGGTQNDESGQALVFRAQAVQRPGAQAGANEN